MATSSDDLIAKMEITRSNLNATLEKLSPEVEIFPSWKLKQLLDHITGWDELVVAALNSFSWGEIAGKTVKHGIDRFNNESVSARKALSYEDSRKAYDTARTAVIQALREIPPEKLEVEFPAPWGGKCTIISMVMIFVGHELEHARQIEEALKKSA